MSLFGLTFDINDSVINRPKANLQDVYGTAGEGRLVDDPLEDVDHGSDWGDRLAGAGHDSGTADGRPADDHLEDEGHDFGTEHGRLAGGLPAGADHDSGMVDGHPGDDHLEGEGRDFDTADGRLVDGLPEGADHDSGKDARLAGLDCVAGLRVSRYRHHRAHTSCGIRPGWR